MSCFIWSLNIGLTVVKLRTTGVNNILLILLKNIDCGCKLELPQGVLMHTLCLRQKYENITIFRVKIAVHCMGILI